MHQNSDKPEPSRESTLYRGERLHDHIISIFREDFYCGNSGMQEVSSTVWKPVRAKFAHSAACHEGNALDGNGVRRIYPRFDIEDPWTCEIKFASQRKSVSTEERAADPSPVPVSLSVSEDFEKVSLNPE